MESNQKSKSTVFLIIVILLLLGGIGVLYVKYSKSLETIKNQEENLVMVNSEKQKLLKELDSLEADIKMHMGENAKLDSLLQIKQEEIEKIRHTLTSQKADIGQVNELKKQIDILREAAKEYIKKIGYLNYKVDSLKTSDSFKQQKIDTMEVESFHKAKKIEELNEKVEIGAQLRVSDMKIITYNKKDKITTRAKRTSKFEINGTMLKNALAIAGGKTVYVRITSPSGIVLTKSSDKQLEFEGKSILFTESKDINYDNTDTRFNLYYNAEGDNLDLGVYRVSVFCEGKEIGSSQIELR